MECIAFECWSAASTNKCMRTPDAADTRAELPAEDRWSRRRAAAAHDNACRTWHPRPGHRLRTRGLSHSLTYSTMVSSDLLLHLLSFTSFLLLLFSSIFIFPFISFHFSLLAYLSARRTSSTQYKAQSCYIKSTKKNCIPP